MAGNGISRSFNRKYVSKGSMFQPAILVYQNVFSINIDKGRLLRYPIQVQKNRPLMKYALKSNDTSACDGLLATFINISILIKLLIKQILSSLSKYTIIYPSNVCSISMKWSGILTTNKWTNNHSRSAPPCATPPKKSSRLNLLTGWKTLHNLLVKASWYRNLSLNLTWLSIWNSQIRMSPKRFWWLFWGWRNRGESGKTCRTSWIMDFKSNKRDHTFGGIRSNYIFLAMLLP